MVGKMVSDHFPLSPPENGFNEYIECSSKTGENADLLFDKITELIGKFILFH